MKTNGIGFPKTYFVWGTLFGGDIATTIMNFCLDNYWLSVAGVMAAAVCFWMAKNTTRPLFAEGWE